MRVTTWANRTWVRRIAVGLAFGAVVTVAIAWWIVLIAPAAAPGVQVRDIVVRTPTPGEYIRLVDERRAVGAYTRRAWVVTPMDAAAQRLVDDRLVSRKPSWLTSDLRFTNMVEEHSGWPLPALRTGWRGGPNGAWPHVEFAWRGGPRQVPLVPLAIGFLLDTLLFGTAYVVLATAVARVWRCVLRRGAEAQVEPRVGVVTTARWVTTGVVLGVVFTVATAWVISITAVSQGVGTGSFGGLSRAGISGQAFTIVPSQPAQPSPQWLTLGGGVGLNQQALSVTGVTYADARTGTEYDGAESRGFGWHCLEVACTPVGSIDTTRARAPRWMVRATPLNGSWNGVFYGWPLKTMSLGGPVSRRAPMQKADLLIVAQDAAYPLPITPVWREFAISVAGVCGVYVGAMVFFARRREVRAGRCRKCLYDLRGLPDGAPCPECGTHARATPATVAT